MISNIDEACTWLMCGIEFCFQQTAAQKALRADQDSGGIYTALSRFLLHSEYGFIDVVGEYMDLHRLNMERGEISTLARAAQVGIYTGSYGQRCDWVSLSTRALGADRGRNFAWLVEDLACIRLAHTSSVARVIGVFSEDLYIREEGDSEIGQGVVCGAMGSLITGF